MIAKTYIHIDRVHIKGYGFEVFCKNIIHSSS